MPTDRRGEERKTTENRTVYGVSSPTGERPPPLFRRPSNTTEVRSNSWRIGWAHSYRNDLRFAGTSSAARAYGLPRAEVPSVTIARRLIVLLTVPLVALLGLGVFTRLQLAEIEARSRFVAESRIAALATLGNLSRGFAELRVNVRSYLLAQDNAQRVAARAAFDQDERDVDRLLQQYADGLV